MEHISELLAAGQTFSFEFFPPKTVKAAETLQQTIADLEPLHPSFVSVTYGAGGSTRSLTHDVVLDIHKKRSIPTMAHLTCVGHSRVELIEIIEQYEQAGIVNLLALAGDPPEQTSYEHSEFRYASELVTLIKSVGNFSIGVAAHPEGHPRSKNRHEDRIHLAEKLKMADFAITQFFFTIEPYKQLVEELSELGCEKPVIPGIMPVTNFGQITRFAELAGAAFPEHLAQLFEAVADDPEAIRELGIAMATELCHELLDFGVPGLHFYTLNTSSATRSLYQKLGLC